MRLLPLLALFAYLVPCLFVFAARLPHTGRNQYGVAIIKARATDQSTTTTAEVPASTGTTISGSTSHATASANSTSRSDPTVSATATTETLATSVPTSNSTAPGELPLQPKITPALGIGGFALIIAGAVLAIIGIRNLWIQVFLSTSFLAGIGVTVLIVYVMSPPVRVAVQGAYLVAIIFTGATFGALSLVFKELTEGLGCLLGGFCGSMWLLSLKPGGLLTQTDAKSGFIGAISVLFYAMSFSQYTRPYGLMASTGISGGTAVALGIDCFSRAGLKEFWLYIWALNDDVFPLGTNTYPVTRNIRVELAATVIIAILGVISQLRLWKVIRARRQKEDEIREKEERENEEAEMENGRRFEEKNMEERLEWEAKYGNPSSGIPELADNSKNRWPADETTDKEKGGATGTRSITSSSSQESYRCSDCMERRANGESAYAASTRSGGTEDSQTRQQEDTIVGIETENLDQSSPDKKRAPTKVFDGAAAAQMEDGNSSDMTAIVGSEAGSTRSRRLSGRSLLDKVSVRDGSRLIFQSQEALVSCDGSSTQGTIDESVDSAPHGHSVAAEDHVEAEDLPILDQEEVPITRKALEANGKEAPELEKAAEKSLGEPSVYSRGVDEHKFDAEEKGVKQEDKQDAVKKKKTCERSPSLSSNQEKDIPEPKREEQSTETPQKVEIAAESKVPIDQKGDKLQAIEPNPEGPTPEEQDERPVEFSQSRELSEEENPLKQKVAFVKQCPPTSESETKSKPKEDIPVRLDAETLNRLPERTSKVVQSYRTNEWAKHLDDAEAPEPEPINFVDEAKTEFSDEAQEAVAPVNVEELLQTPLNAQTPPAVERRVSLVEPSGTNENHQTSNDTQLPRSSRSKKRASSGQPAYPPADIVQSAPLITQAQPSQETADAHNTYDSVPPVVHSVEKPREEIEMVKPQWKGPLPLIAVREGMVQNRLSSYSLSTGPWPSRFAPGTEVSPRQSTLYIPEDADDIPLSRRRTMLHHQTISFPQPSVSPIPVRRSAASRLNTPGSLAAWRESVRENVNDRWKPAAPSTPIASPMTSDRNPTSSRRLRGNASSVKVENAIAEGMQRGDMTDLHREAMRRMQAKANRGANGK